jgi:membrane protease YdiL (CAAX protease family)
MRPARGRACAAALPQPTERAPRWCRAPRLEAVLAQGHNRPVLTDNRPEASAGAEPAPPVAPERGPGLLSLVAWIVFFAANLALAYLPFLGALGGDPDLFLRPGLLDDPLMVAATIVGSWLTFLIAAGLVWRARLTRADVGWVGVPARPLLKWTAITVAGLLGTWVAASLLLGEHLKIISPLTEPPRGVAGWALWWGLAWTAGISEESVMRGYGIGLLLRSGANRWAAAVGMSALFGALHIYEGAHAVPLLAIWGFLFALPYLRTGSLLPGILAHAIVNGIAPLFLSK